MSSTDEIILKSSDGESFKVKEALARRSRTISPWIDDGIPGEPIDLPKVTGKILSKVIEYWEKHVVDFDDLRAWGAEVDQTDLFDLIQNFSKLIVHYKEPVVDGVDLKAWDAEFVKVDQATLYDLIEAAVYLDIKGLLDLGCQTVADEIKSRPPEEIRKAFSIKNDFKPEEEEEVRRETHWKFE